MAYHCSLDLLPIELLYNVFNYFSSQEILLSFTDLSDYITTVISSYPSYQWDFQAIRKSDFDLVCARIRPDQVISLTLSDDDETPGLSEACLSRFPIEQFVHLRSLRLIEIEIDSLKLLFPDLHKLPQLRSLSFNSETIRREYSDRNVDYANESAQLKSLLSQTYSQVLPRLTHVDLYHSVDLATLTLPELRHLKLSTFTNNELEMIFQKSRQLKSLDIALHMNALDSEIIVQANQLIRLKLKIESIRSTILFRTTNLLFFSSRSTYFSR